MDDHRPELARYLAVRGSINLSDTTQPRPEGEITFTDNR
ncbi:hypothetical protein L838_3197 [Mycobacterium avium MAV_120709_2344]|nr:hypothetical protein L838_3197 [Mycobacterium avium MAV_120709_2344]